MMSLVVDHLWQSTLVVIVAWLLTLVLRNNAARFRYWVWLAASIKFLAPFSLLTMLGNQFSWQSFEPVSASNVFFTTVQQFTEPLATPEIVLRSPQALAFDFLPVVFSIWMLGCILLLARWSMSWFRIVAAVRSAVPVAIESPIAVKSTQVMSEPGVVGVLRPVLLLPEGIAARLTAAQMQSILAHELCHVRRRDNLTATIHMLVEALFWFHPLVWWIGARLVEERERACDESVVELGNEPQAYAEGILKVCQFYLESKLTCVAGVSGANLKKRVEVIMSNRIAENLNSLKKILLAATAAAMVAVPASFGLMAGPQALAQEAGRGPSAFDQVSIQATVPPTTGPATAKWLIVKDGNFSVKKYPLRGLIAFAYDRHITQVVGGPEWCDSLLIDIEAKSHSLVEVKGADNRDLYRRMVKSLLADRFGIHSHKETRSLEAFVLTVGEQGSLLPETASARPDWATIGGNAIADKGGITFHDVRIQVLTDTFAAILGRPIFDRTNLTGKYFFRLERPFTADTLPSVVLKQLGLKLEQQMLPLEVFVIDSALPPVFDLPSAAIVNTKVSTVAPLQSAAPEVDQPRANAASPTREMSSRKRIEHVDDVVTIVDPAVASVTPTVRASSPATSTGPQVIFAGNAFSATNATLKDLIKIAYGGLPNQIIGGPAWMDGARFDVTFKLAAPVLLPNDPENDRGGQLEGYQAMQLKLRGLLADRFNLLLRQDSDLVYTLVAATDGVKLQKTNAATTGGWRGIRDNGQSVVAQSATTQDLIRVLSARLARPVLNRTALGDSYDFELRLPADEPPFDARVLSGVLSEQLGLSLGVIDIPTMIVERASKPAEVI